MNVPWQNRSDWEEKLKEVVSHYAPGSSGSEKAEVAAEMCVVYGRIEPLLNDLCSKTCPECDDPCCQRATVWFDERDLLFLLLSTGSFPAEQVYRRKEGRCCHLGPTGCKLPRYRRPFICTWYLCPAQKLIVREGSGALIALIEQIKALRKRLGG